MASLAKCLSVRLRTKWFWVRVQLESRYIFSPIKETNWLKELRNCISSIIRLWSLFCSIRVYASLHFLPILLEN